MITWEQVIDQMDQFESNVSNVRKMLEINEQNMRTFRQILERQVQEQKAFQVDESPREGAIDDDATYERKRDQKAGSI